MSEDNTGESIVIWHPSCALPTVPDDRELTSLCLLHDKVILTSFGLFGVQPDDQERAFQILLKRPYPYEATAFIKKVQFLVKHQVITLESKTPYKFTCSSEGQIIGKIGNEQQQIQPPDSLATRFVVSAFNAFLTVLNNRELKDTDREELADSTYEMVSYSIARFHKYPFVTSDRNLKVLDDNPESGKMLTEILAQSSIYQLALPDIRATHAEDILEARFQLIDELLEFRAGILKLTYLLHQQVQNKNDLEEIRQEANILTSTIIKGSLLSLEGRMRQHKTKTIRRMLFGTGRILVEATKLFFPAGTAKKMISGGKSLLQLATEIDNATPPEDQVATYLYRLKGKLTR